MFKVFVSRLILLTVALILCACSEALSATTEDISNFARPSFKLFTDKQGLPQNTIQAITVDQRGYVWAGTQDGAAYYNGRVWKVVDMPNRTLSNFINSICAASDGSIWFGTNGGGANRLKDGKWINYNTTNSLPSDTVSSIIESKDATVWIATRKGLVKFQNENWTLYNSDSGLPSNQITALLETTSEKGKRQLWVGTFDKGLAVLEDGKWIKFDRQNGLPSNSIVCMLETSSKSGKSLIWIGTRKEETSDGGIACYDNGVWKSYNTKNGFPDDTIWSMLQTRSKTGHLSLWVGTRDGGLVVSHSVLMEEEASWLAYDAETGMPGNEARFLYPSTLKNEPSPYFWVGFAGAGLARFNQGQWVSFDTKTHLPHSQINSILESNGTFWLGTDDGLANYEDGKWITFNKNNGLPHNQINALLETISDDNKSAVWIGTRGYLARYQDGKIDIFDEKSGLPGKVIWSLAETKSRDGIRYLWAGTNKGLAQIELSEVGKKKWTVFDTSNGLPNATIGPLLKVDFKKSSSLWIGTDNGLARYHNGKWSVFNTDSGLPNNNIYSIHESRDSDGKRYLWVGTNGGGVARTELTKSLNPQSVKWTVFSDSTTPALPNNVIYQVLDDRYNRIYLMTNKGVTRLTPRNPTDNDKSEYSVYTFNTENGLPSNECDFGASIVDSRGRIWAGTVLGAGLFDPAEEIEDRLEKPFFASSMILGSNTLLPNGTSLRHNQNNVVFDFTLLSYFREADTRYQTQLVGLNQEPSEWTADSNKEYTNLGEGSYTFKVWAKDHAGNIFGPLEVAFLIKPAPWRTYWAYTLYLFATAGIIYGGIRWRLQRLRQLNEELERKVSERTVELDKKNEELAETVEALKKSKEEIEEKHKELFKAHEALVKSKEDLVASYKKVDRIFSALSNVLPGNVLDNKYRLEDKIGSGGFGAVYRATHLGMKRSVAVKIFHPSAGNATVEGLERFQMEAISACRINHPNAVAVLDSGITETGIAYLVMELLEGHSLTSEIRHQKTLTPLRTAKIVFQVCDALEEAHRVGIVHRDIKPDNIFLHQSGGREIVKVVDFGIAKLMGSVDSGVTLQSLTENNSLIGTPIYMSPERIDGRPYDGRSDVYSLGIMVYEMLCGQVPFDSADRESFWSIAMMHMMKKPQHPSILNSDLPQGIGDVVMRALKKEPEARPTAKEFAQEFCQAVGFKPEEATNIYEKVIFEKLPPESPTIIQPQKTNLKRKETDPGFDSETSQPTQEVTVIKQRGDNEKTTTNE